MAPKALPSWAQLTFICSKYNWIATKTLIKIHLMYSCQVYYDAIIQKFKQAQHP